MHSLASDHARNEVEGQQQHIVQHFRKSNHLDRSEYFHNLRYQRILPHARRSCLQQSPAYSSSTTLSTSRDVVCRVRNLRRAQTHSERRSKDCSIPCSCRQQEYAPRSSELPACDILQELLSLTSTARPSQYPRNSPNLPCTPGPCRPILFFARLAVKCNTLRSDPDSSKLEEDMFLHQGVSPIPSQ